MCLYADRAVHSSKVASKHAWTSYRIPSELRHEPVHRHEAVYDRRIHSHAHCGPGHEPTQAIHGLQFFHLHAGVMVKKVVQAA